MTMRDLESKPISPGDATLHITQQVEGLMMATFGPICIAVWQAKPVRKSFDVQRAQLASAVRGNPSRQLFLCVVSARAPAPEQEIREASAAMLDEHGEKLAGCACVIEGSGFRAAITRTVLSGISLLARSRTPVSFFDSVDSATPWLQRLAAPERIGGLALALEAARSEVSGGGRASAL